MADMKTWGPYVSPDPYGTAQPHEWRHGGSDHRTQRAAAPQPPYPQPLYLQPPYAPLPTPQPPYAPYPRPPYVKVRPPGYDEHAFVVPMVATVLAAPVIAFDGIIAMFSPMATDSCTATGCQDLTRMLLVAPAVLVLATAALVSSWALPWRRRFRAPRIAAALAGPLLALTTLYIYCHLPAAS